MVFARTEVGTPEGDKIAKNIGPAGGTLTSADGRMTLTVPANALTETIPFSMQPITNKAGGGLGLAYRLEPDGRTFATPLQISVRYDEKDLEGTIPQAMSIAYQDEKRTWHAQRAKLDEAAKTLTVAVTHFTDYAFLSRMKMSPTKATLRPGETQVLTLVHCRNPTLLGRVLSRPQTCESTEWFNEDVWEVQGPGTVESAGPSTAVYTAPGRKPTPNVAHVLYPYRFEDWDEARSALVIHQGVFTAEITIVNRGYKASGSDGPTSYSGTVCSLEEPFTIIGTNDALVLTNKFTPAGGGRSGTGTTVGGFSGLSWNGSGSYKVDGFDSDNPWIIFDVSTTVTGLPLKGSGSGTAHIVLNRLETDECNQ